MRRIYCHLHERRLVGRVADGGEVTATDSEWILVADKLVQLVGGVCAQLSRVPFDCPETSVVRSPHMAWCQVVGARPTEERPLTFDVPRVTSQLGKALPPDPVLVQLLV